MQRSRTRPASSSPTASPRPPGRRRAEGRPRTWINTRIRKIDRGLFDLGHCQTVEVYDGGDLVGGLYGVTLGRAFFGESMFHRARDASKIALVHLVARLIAGSYVLCDTQYVTEHLKTFGAVDVPKKRYHRLLDRGLAKTEAYTILARALLRVIYHLLRTGETYDPALLKQPSAPTVA